MRGPMVGRTCGRLGVVALAIAVPSATDIVAQQPPTTAGPQLRSGIDLVLVDTTVVDGRDHPVEGLAAADFLVKVDAVPRPLASLEYVHAIANRRGVTTASAPTPPATTGPESARLAARTLVLVTAGTYATPERADEVRRVAEAAARSRVHLHAIQAWNVLWGMNPEYRGGSAMPRPNQSLTAEVTLAARSGGLWLTTPAGPAGFDRLSRQLTGWYVLGIEWYSSEATKNDILLEDG